MTTSPLTLRLFFAGQIRAMQEAGYQVAAITGGGPELENCRRELDVEVHSAALRRTINPWADLCAIASVARILLSLRPDILHTHTPKAGLIGMLAGFLCRVPCRLYTVNGLPLSTLAGWRRQVMRATEKLSSRLATEVICVSNSLRTEILRLGLSQAEKTRVLGYGASHGVSLPEFDPNRFSEADRCKLRRELALPEGALVFGFVGRLTADKGVCELADAWRIVRAEVPGSYLMICGLAEQRSGLPAGLLESLQKDPRVRVVSPQHTDMPSRFALMDVAVLPTYREGLPNVALEAAAMSVPLVATTVMGCVDVVRHGHTGLLVPPGDAGSLSSALRRLAVDPEQRQRLGAAAYSFVAKRFTFEKVTVSLLDEYARLLDLASGAEPLLYQVKWAADWLGAAFLLILLLPLLALIAVAVRVTMGGPVLFCQRRIGKDERPFEIRKFRTMNGRQNAQGELLPDEQRLTGFGQFLRRYSLDELPQLWNVLAGEMSLVGPRPLLPQYLPRYTREQRRRHAMRPGLTGLAQVSGRNALSWEAKFKLDVEYVDRWSLLLDVEILCRTFSKVLGSDGIGAEGQATMPEFLGSAERKQAS